MVKGDVLAIIFFAILFGIGVLLAGEAGKPVADFFNSASEAVLKMTFDGDGDRAIWCSGPDGLGHGRSRG